MIDMSSLIALFILFSSYIFLKYGLPILLVIVGYFIFKRYRKNTEASKNKKPNQPVKQGNLKP